MAITYLQLKDAESLLNRAKQEYLRQHPEKTGVSNDNLIKTVLEVYAQNGRPSQSESVNN